MMKRLNKHLTTYLLLAIACIGLQSCLFQEEDYFEESAANRQTEAVNQYSKLLRSADNGWLLEYYIGEDYTLGGISIFCKFTDEKVTMASTFSVPEVAAGDNYTSYYQVIAEQETLLSFNTYNPILHYFGMPDLVNPNNPNANLEGDYEFILRSATDTQIVLEGKKYGNTMVMTRLDAGFDWNGYISKANAIEQEAFLETYDMHDGGTTVGSLTRSNYTFEYTPAEGGESVSMPFVYTDTGLKLREPVSINNKEVQNFDWDESTMTFSCTNEGANGIALVGTYPEGYMQYEDFIGTYKMTARIPKVIGQIVDWSQSVMLTVNIQPDVDKESYTMSCAEWMTDVPLSYNKATGAVTLKATPTGTYGKYYMGCCMATQTGYYPSFDSTFALDAEVASLSPLTFSLVDTGSGYQLTGFAFIAFNDNSYSPDAAAGYMLWYDSVTFEKQ